MRRASCVLLVGCAALGLAVAVAAVVLIASSARMAAALSRAAAEPLARRHQVGQVLSGRSLPQGWQPLFAAEVPLLGEVVGLADRSPEDELASGARPDRWAAGLRTEGWIAGLRDAGSVERDLLELLELEPAPDPGRLVDRARWTAGDATVLVTVRRERLGRSGREVAARVTLARVTCPGGSRPGRTVLVVERLPEGRTLPEPRSVLSDLLPVLAPCSR